MGRLKSPTANLVIGLFLAYACLRDISMGDALWAAIAAVGCFASFFNFALGRKGY